MGGRNASRSPARLSPVYDSSRHSLSQQLSRTVTDWLSGDDKNRRREAPRSDDRRPRATERHRDTGRGRRRSVSTESSLVSYSRSHSRASDRSDPTTELGSRSSYTSYTSSSRHKSRRSHHQRRRDRSSSGSLSRSSSRERTHSDRKKAIKTGLILLSSVAAATAAAQKYWSKDDREGREPDLRDSQPRYHQQRSTNERVREESERARDELGRRREGMKSRETAAVRHSVERRDTTRSGNTSATPIAKKRGVPISNPDLSNRERLGLNDGLGIKPTPAPTAPASVTSSSMRTEPARSVYHPHYEDTQYAVAPEDDEAIWMPVEERVSLNSRGETVVQTIEKRVAPPSEVAAKRKANGGNRGDADVFRVVERYKIMDEWDPRWKKY